MRTNDDGHRRRWSVKHSVRFTKQNLTRKLESWRAALRFSKSQSEIAFGRPAAVDPVGFANRCSFVNVPRETMQPHRPNPRANYLWISNARHSRSSLVSRSLFVSQRCVNFPLQSKLPHLGSLLRSEHTSFIYQARGSYRPKNPWIAFDFTAWRTFVIFHPASPAFSDRRNFFGAQKSSGSVT